MVVAGITGSSSFDELRLIAWATFEVERGASADVSIFRSVSTPVMILPLASTP
ncbi:hypothetical protein D3C72_2455640 [compost metagenome]